METKQKKTTRSKEEIVQETPQEKPPVKKKKMTQAAWDKWVRQCIISVSPDVWGTHTSEVSHETDVLTDIKRMPLVVMLDTPTLDYLFRNPSRLSHNARLVLNEEDMKCIVCSETIMEWAEKIRSGHYLISKENSFFEKVLDRFELLISTSTMDVYQKYIDLKALSSIDVSWEANNDEVVTTRLNVDERPTRMIAAHALTLGVTIVSPDLRYNAYKKDGLKVIW